LLRWVASSGCPGPARPPGVARPMKLIAGDEYDEKVQNSPQMKRSS
jgi:hypothetical protein